VVDLCAFVGAQIRDSSGRNGRLVPSNRLSEIKIAWDTPDSIVPTYESVFRSDRRLVDDLQVLTMDRGWVAVSELEGITNIDSGWGSPLDG
jgi:hypothetical protein